jgi:hypothetical protein
MRLVLIDKQNRVRGDTADLAAHSFAWAYASNCGKGDVANLATIAARLLDAKLGHASRGYSFSTFTSSRDSDGYFVFDCGCRAVRAPRILADGAGPEATAEVMTACFYVGYVRRDD